MEIPVHNEDMKDDDTQILPCISLPQPYEDTDNSLRYPVLGAFMNVSSRELRTHQEYWNRTTHANRLRIIAEERRIRSEMRDFKVILVD